MPYLRVRGETSVRVEPVQRVHASAEKVFLQPLPPAAGPILSSSRASYNSHEEGAYLT